jgi:hypothetical protein
MISNLELHRPEGYSAAEVQTLSKISKDLMGILSAAQKSFTHNTLRLSRQSLKELCVVVVEFAEDLIHRIGSWENLEKYNQKFFGTPLPFSLAVGQEMPEALINKNRIHYLLWNKYSELCDGLILSPSHMDLNLQTEEVFQFFNDHRIAAFPKKSSVKTFMNRPNQYGWDIKKKLVWLGQYSYLFRHSYEIYIREHGGTPDIPTIDDFLCQHASRWSGLGVPDVLAAMLDISKKQRDELQSWHLRHFAYFQIESIKGPLVVAKNIICDRQYWIRVGEQSKIFKVGHVYIGSLVPWNGEWYWSGQQTGFGEVPLCNLEELVKEFIQKSPQITYRYCESLLEKAKKSVKLHYRNFIEYHGDDLAVFPDGYAMAAAVQKQHRTEYEARSKELVKEVMKKYNLKNPYPIYSYPQEVLDSDNGIGLFFNQDEGQEIMLGFNDVLRGFKKKGVRLTEDEFERIRGFIESEAISQEFVMKLAKKYGSESVSGAFLLRDIESIDCLNYILRKYKGHHFRERYPNLSFK